MENERKTEEIEEPLRGWRAEGGNADKRNRGSQEVLYREGRRCCGRCIRSSAPIFMFAMFKEPIVVVV
jgi:hypothetical protein